MKINIDEIKNAPDKKVEIDFSDNIEEFNHKEMIKAALVASASECGVNISGKIKADLVLECDRCLEKYVYNMDADINEELVEEIQDEEEIDIKDFVYQSIILDLPYKCLCKADCAGSEELQKLNNAEYIDERLEVFKTL